MNSTSLLETLRQWVVVISLSIGSSIFWGLCVAAIFKYVFAVDSQTILSWIVVGSALLIGIFLMPLVWRKMRGQY